MSKKSAKAALAGGATPATERQEVSAIGRGAGPGHQQGADELHGVGRGDGDAGAVGIARWGNAACHSLFRNNSRDSY